MVALNIFSSCFTFLLAFVANFEYYQAWLMLFPFFQGVGFASCDAFGNQFLLEMWRDPLTGENTKGQSWVHIIHAGFFLGYSFYPKFIIAKLQY
jgi:MFS family permease